MDHTRFSAAENEGALPVQRNGFVDTHTATTTGEFAIQLAEACRVYESNVRLPLLFPKNTADRKVEDLSHHFHTTSWDTKSEVRMGLGMCWGQPSHPKKNVFVFLCFTFNS